MSAAPASGALSRRGQAAGANISGVDVNSPEALSNWLMANVGTFNAVAQRIVGSKRPMQATRSCLRCQRQSLF